MSMTSKKVYKYSVIEFLITHGVSLEGIVNSTLDNLSDAGFTYGEKNIEITAEILEHLGKHVLSLKDELLFPGGKGKQSVPNMIVGLQGYLKETNRTLADLGIQSTYSPRQEIHFDSVVDIKKYLQNKLGTSEQPTTRVSHKGNKRTPLGVLIFIC